MLLQCKGEVSKLNIFIRLLAIYISLINCMFTSFIQISGLFYTKLLAFLHIKKISISLLKLPNILRFSIAFEFKFLIFIYGKKWLIYYFVAFKELLFKHNLEVIIQFFSTDVLNFTDHINPRFKNYQWLLVMVNIKLKFKIPEHDL